MPLAPLTDPDAVPYTVATVLGVTAAAGQPIVARLVSALCRRRALLVLDNCEHVLNGAAGLTRQLREACPGVVILATSRQALRVPGEQVLNVGPFDKHSVAPAAIFLDRARLAGGTISAEDEPTIRVICDRLDGIPLAIELAAARTRSTSPAELLARLDHQMRVLGSRAVRSGPGETRHLTMRQAIEWSFNLLADSERWLFTRMSVFSGSVEFGAIRAVAAPEFDEYDLADLIDALVERSIVVAERRGSVTRYRLLEPLRQFAETQLNDVEELAQLRLRHLAFFARFVTEADSAVETSGMGVWMTATDDALPNIRSALFHALDIGDLARAYELSTRPFNYWFERIGGEQLGWQQATEAAMAAAEHPLLPNLWAHLSITTGQLVGAAEGVTVAIRALERLEPGRDRFIAHFMAFLFSAAAGRPDEALRWSELASAEIEACPTTDYWQVIADHARALALWGQDRAAAQVFADRTLPAARRIGNESLLAFVLANGLNAKSVPEAIEQCDEAIELGDRAGLVQSRGVGLYMRAEYLARLPDSSDEEVFQAMLAALDVMERAGSQMQAAMVVEYAARAFAHRGHAAIAAQIFGAQDANDLLPVQARADGRRRQRAIDAASEVLSDAGYARHEAAGYLLDLAALTGLVRQTLTTALANL